MAKTKTNPTAYNCEPRLPSRAHTPVGRLRLGVAVIVVVMGVAQADVRAQEEVVQDEIFSWDVLSLPDEATQLEGAFIGVSGDALLIAGGRYWSTEHDGNGNGDVYSDQVFVLTDPNGQWQRLDVRLPRPLANGLSVQWEDKLICLGGKNDGGDHPDAFMLHFRDGEFVRTDLPAMPGATTRFCGAVLGDRVYVTGVSLRSGNRKTGPEATKIFWALDLPKDGEYGSWKELDPWPGPPRSLAIATVQEDAFFLCGGMYLGREMEGRRHRELLRDAYRFRPTQGWKQVSDLPNPVAAVPGVAVGQTHLLILGEAVPPDLVRGPRTLHFSREILAYETITDTWRKLGTLPENIGRREVPYVFGSFSPRAIPVTTWWRERLVLLADGVGPDRLFWGEVKKVTKSRLRRLDYVSLFGYLALLVGMGIYFARREKSTEQFFLAGRKVPWWAAGISLFGTQLSAITFMAIPAMVYRTNWVYFFSQLTNVLVIVTVIYIFLPFYRRLNVTTAYEYLEKRYDVSVRLLGSGAFVFFHLIRMGIILYLPALALSAVTGLDIYLCILVMGVIATFYTTLGGIEAVVWTDVIQAFLLLGGALSSFFIIIAGVPGGISGIVQSAASENKLTLANLNWDITTAALWVVVIGGYMNSVGVYSSDQTVVQRYLTTRDERMAARSMWTHLCIAIPSAVLFFGLGTALWAFFKSHPELLSPTLKTDQIFPWFIAGQLPAGISGLVIAAMFAAAMSSLDSSMNSMATAITTDFYRRFRTGVSDAHCLVVARTLTAVLGVLGTCFALYTAKLGSRSIWDLNFEIAGLFGAGLAGLFAAGVLTRRTSGAGILVGFFASGLVLYFVKYWTDAHFFMYGAAGISSCVFIGWLASWILPGCPKDLAGLTIYSLNRTSRDN